MYISRIFIDRKVEKEIRKKHLTTLFQKAIDYLKDGNFPAVQFKKRRPYKTQKYYFRINKQYRAIGVFQGDDFYIFEVNDHQN